MSLMYQKLGTILENKLLQNWSNQKVFYFDIFLIKFFFRQILLIFDMENEKFTVFDDLFLNFGKRCECHFLSVASRVVHGFECGTSKFNFEWSLILTLPGIIKLPIGRIC